MMGGLAPIALHAQLGPLVEFLEFDDRPTAIFLRPQGHEEAPADKSSVYENGPFAKLDYNEDFVKAVLESLRASAASGGHGPLATHAGLPGWQLRPLGGQFEALVRGVAEDRTCSGQATGLSSLPSEPPPINSSSKLETNIADTTPTDWTQYDVPGLSPWIQHVRAVDWSETELGPICSWSSTLRGHMLSLMANPNPRLMTWGPRMTFVYNEACIPHWGAKHPDCLGKPIWEAWSELWPSVEGILKGVYSGRVMQQRNLALPMARNGYPEDTYFDYTMLPLYGPEGKIEGIIDELQETTATVRWNRRKESLIRFGKSLATASDLDTLWSSSLQGLESAVNDVAFALLYAVYEEPDRPASASTMSSGSGSKATKQTCILQGSVGLSAASPTIPQTFALQDASSSPDGILTACAKACKNRVPVALNSQDDSLPEVLRAGVPDRAFGDAIQRAVVTPIVSISGNQILAVMVAGINPRCAFDSEYSLYFDYLGDTLTKAASRISLPQEQKRTQEIHNDANMALSAELHLMTMQAERSEAKFARMSAEAPTGIFISGRDGRPLYANDEYLRIVGETREKHFEATSNVPSDELVHDEDVERFQEAYRRVMEQKLPVTIEYRLKKPWSSIDKATGHEMVGERWILVNAFPDLNYDGKLQSVQGWVSDISHRRFTEKLVSRKLEEALESKRLTENFIDMTSHEMRNPLSAILQSSDAIVTLIQTANALPPRQDCFGQSCTLDNDAAEEILDAAQTIVLCAQHQRRIVDDILTLSKLDASLVEMCPEKVSLPTLLDKSLRMFQAEIARVDTRTEVIVESSYNELHVESVVLDASRLLQIIINLVTNSIKFIQGSQRREITMSLGASYEKPTGQHHGVSFVPCASEEPVRTPATGWGDGEDIYVQIAVTDTGRGLSEDELKLLFHRFSQGSPKTYKQYGGSGLGLYICRQLCELQGGQIGASCADGKTTFSFYVRAQRWQPNQNDQDEHTERSTWAAEPKRSSKRTRPGPNGASTSPARLEHRPDGEHTRSSLRNQQYSGERSASRIEEKEIAVLLVEDNKINQKITSQQLRKAGGHTVHVADHGQECLDYLEQTTFCSEDAELSLILLDLEMPVMDGWTCAREIRQRQRDGKIAGHVPIIAVTANARPEQIASAMDAGADAVVTKPFRTSDLIPRMREVMAEVAQREEDG